MCQLSAVSFPRLCLVSEEADNYYNAVSRNEKRLVLTLDFACCSSTQQSICALLPPQQQTLCRRNNVHRAHHSCTPSNLGVPLGTGICSQLCQSLHVDPDLLLLPQGHKSQIICLAFAPDATKMVTASKDGTWRVWNINIRYHQQEDPKTLLQHQQEVMVALGCMHMQRLL